jgi:hypothetical protein
MDAASMPAPVVLLTGAVYLLALPLFWLMVRHCALLQEILRVQNALLQVATALQSAQDPAPAAPDRRNGHAENIKGDPRGCPLLASEQRSAADNFQTDAKLRHIGSSGGVSTAMEDPGPGAGHRGAGVAQAPQSQKMFYRTKSAPATPPTDMKGRRKNLSSGTAGYCLCSFFFDLITDSFSCAGSMFYAQVVKDSWLHHSDDQTTDFSQQQTRTDMLLRELFLVLPP